LGDHYSHQKRWSDAVNTYTKSVTLQPAPDVLFHLAASLEHIGTPIDALHFYQRSVNASGDASFDRSVAHARINALQP